MCIAFRAIERWGSMEAIENEVERRREAMEAGERYRKGLYHKSTFCFALLLLLNRYENQFSSV